MNPRELAEHAARNIEAGADTLLVLPPRRGWPRRVRVAGGNGAKILWGDPVADVERGLLVRVDSKSLLAWLVAYAGVEVEVTAKDAPGMKVLLSVDGGSS